MIAGTLFVAPAASIAETIRIGETTALIPEAGLALNPVLDGGNGNVNFPYGNFKALATVGEVGDNGLALTGYPDGQAAYLLDNDTIRVVYQSESYATMGKAPVPETYNWEMKNGVTFSGSHIHTIDYDRAKFAKFMLQLLKEAKEPQNYDEFKLLQIYVLARLIQFNRRRPGEMQVLKYVCYTSYSN